MRHATDLDLDRIDALLQQVRQCVATGFVERKRGVFYLRGRAFLHFHEHDGQLLADVRIHDDFERVSLDDGGVRLLAILAQCLA